MVFILIEKVKQQKDSMFADVLDDYGQLFSVLSHFQEWKLSFYHSYDLAYIPHCLPKLLAPYVSLQLLLWNPLDSNSHEVDFLDMSFFKNLLLFSMKSEADVLMIPEVVELIIIPKLAGINKKYFSFILNYSNIFRFHSQGMGSTFFHSVYVAEELYS